MSYTQEIKALGFKTAADLGMSVDMLQRLAEDKGLRRISTGTNRWFFHEGGAKRLSKETHDSLPTGYMWIDDAALRIGLSTASVGKLAREGKIKAVMVVRAYTGPAFGYESTRRAVRTWAFDQTSVAAFIADRTAKRTVSEKAAAKATTPAPITGDAYQPLMTRLAVEVDRLAALNNRMEREIDSTFSPVLG